MNEAEATFAEVAPGERFHFTTPNGEREGERYGRADMNCYRSVRDGEPYGPVRYMALDRPVVRNA